MKNSHPYIIAVLLTLVFLPSNGICANKFTLKVEPKQSLTGMPIKGVKACLIPLDSNDTIFAKESTMKTIDMNGNVTPVVTLSFNVPSTPATYILSATANGYEEVTRTVTIDKIGRREFEKKISDLIFYKKAKELGEVTVTASKVKFYMHGDTLIYNADAFQLSDGSMLDGLVKQLPGVEIKDGGQIYVNGKFVESLLLNGKDFFKGNNEIMLNNLGAYTVKNISVYDKWGEKSRLAGQDMGDTEYVMDVKLKRDYLSGFTGNIEGGAGTSSRYLGRLFGMWYTIRSRVTLIGSINNLNDRRRPGQNDNFKASTVPGDFRTKMVGLDYNLFGDTWDFSGSSSVNHTRNSNIQTMNKTNFLTLGNTYENRFSNALSHNLDISSRNYLTFSPENKSISLDQTFRYTRNKQSSTALSGAFSEEISDLNRQLLEQIYSGKPTSFSDININTSLSEALMSGHTLEVGGGVSFDSKMSHSPDIIGIGVSGNYKENHYRNFNRYDINYSREGTHSIGNTYTQGYPDRSWTVSVNPNYNYIPNTNTSIGITPGYSHTSSSKDSYFYRLDRLGDAGVFGSLPAGYESTIDNGQTYFSTSASDMVSLNINYLGRYSLASGGRINLQIMAFPSYNWRHLDYRQPDYYQPVHHNSFNLQLRNTNITYNIGRNQYKLLYERTCNPVELSRLVNITDTRDPLNVFTGSSSLKNAFDNKIELSWIRRVMTRHRWANTMTVRFNIIENALVNGYSYDKTTGVRTYSMNNVSGNWRSNFSNYFSKTFGKIDQFDVSSVTGISFSHDADMTSSGNSPLEKYTVKNLNLSQTIRLNWRFAKQQVGLNASIVWRDTRSGSPDFSPLSATTSQYGVSGQFKLPHNFGISTDVNIYTRRGYAYDELNTTDVVWNARLSYTSKCGKWLFMLDGFDLLSQLSNVTYAVNAQGRVETYNNVLPRYGLFHVQYRFAIQPKKK